MERACPSLMYAGPNEVMMFRSSIARATCRAIRRHLADKRLLFAERAQQQVTYVT